MRPVRAARHITSVVNYKRVETGHIPPFCVADRVELRVLLADIAVTDNADNKRSQTTLKKKSVD